VKVGILGSGDVAQALGRGFLKHGHAVMMGTREPSKLADWVRGDPNFRVGQLGEAAQFGELVVLGSAAAEALRTAGAANFAGKTVVDVTNPLSDDSPANGVHSYFTSLEESLMERLQREFPDAHFVKAFNQVNNSRMVNPQFDGIRPTMFICGNDTGAKATVTRILDQFGWETEDIGQVEAARAIEPLCMLWAIRHHLRKKWDHASSC
jgi:8-hydroxy-5-deazaflavin:NADPH oxidoreductase